MLGRQHLMLSVATVSIFLIPYLQEAQALVMVMFLGAAIGSLIPDVDAPDAAIFHNDIRGLNGEVGKAVNNFIGPLLPIFGKTTKYAIYKPAVYVFDRFVLKNHDLQEKHRTFSHSFLGVFTMASVTGLYMIPVLIFLDLFAPLFLLGFLVAYVIGAFLHMLEDSCTITGIAWNSPFSKTKLSGDISTGKDIRKPRYFLYFLGMTAFGVFYLSSSEEYGVTDPMISGSSLIFVGISWFVFTKFVAKVKLSK